MMIKNIASLFMAFCMCLILSACEEKPAVDISGNFTAITNVNVLPMGDDPSKVLNNQTVLIKDGVISAIGKTGDVDIPDGSVVIDGQGEYLMPGLSEMHAHIGAATADPKRMDQVAENNLLIYLATGVTLVRDVAGTENHLRWRDNLADGTWTGPMLFVSSPIFEGERRVWPFTNVVTDPEVARSMLRDFHQQGYWGSKIYHTISPEVFAALMDEGKKLNFPIFGHVPFDVGIKGSLAAGMDGIEHLRGYDFHDVPIDSLWANGGRSSLRFGSWARMTEEQTEELVNASVQSKVWNTPTLIINKLLYNKPLRGVVAMDERFSLAHKDIQRAMIASNSLDKIFPRDSITKLESVMPKMQSFVVELQRAGGNLLIGTDSFLPGVVPGFSVIDEMEMFADAGLSNAEVLQIATVNAARAMGIDDEYGSIKVGMKSDMVLVEENPLEDIANLWRLKGVILQGQWLSAETMKAMLLETSGQSTPVQQ